MNLLTPPHYYYIVYEKSGVAKRQRSFHMQKYLHLFQDYAILKMQINNSINSDLRDFQQKIY